MKFQLRRLTLQRFRCFAEHTVDLTEHVPTVLRGPNGIGKTTVLEALSMLAGGRGLRGADPAEQALRTGTTPGWCAIFEFADEHILRLAYSGQGGVVAAIDNVRVTRRQATLPVLWLAPEHDRLFVSGKEAGRAFFNRAAEVMHAGHAEALESYGRDLRERMRVLQLQQNSDQRWLDGIEARAAEAGAAIFVALSDLCADLCTTGALRVTPYGALFDLCRGAELADVRALLQYEWHARRARDAAAQMTTFGVHRLGFSVFDEAGHAAATLSSGEQKLLLLRLFAAMLHTAKRRGVWVLPLIDDLNAYLDAERATQALTFICEALPDAVISFSAA